MSDNAFRIVALNALIVILIGMFAGGLPLVAVVAHETYHQPLPFFGGDYRAWLMAHLEGLLNGLLMLAVAATTRLRPLGRSSEKWLVISLLVAGWGNAVASVLAPLLGVRGMVFDAQPANDFVASVFTAALAGSIAAITIAVRALTRRQ